MGGGIGGLLNMNQSGLDYAYLYDGKGNVTALIDDTESVVSTYTYDTFGVLKAKTGTINQPFMFSTKRYDEALGTSYYGYRFYSPALSRWITRDPIGESGGLNLYGFVGNSPINWSDPWGLAYFAMRPLTYFSSFMLNTPFLDAINLEVSHEQLFFEDAKGENKGFFDDSMVRDDRDGDLSKYEKFGPHYEDDLMHRAVDNVKTGKYDRITNNCQDWADKVRREYKRLKRERDRKKCSK